MLDPGLRRDDVIDDQWLFKVRPALVSSVSVVDPSPRD
jgi:hypothetical protein